ncbi:MAG: antibiotic biosynthesis monooxygenase family protein [Bacteroidota bacterium]
MGNTVFAQSKNVEHKAEKHPVLEMVVYKIKSDVVPRYQEILEQARAEVSKFEGFIGYRTFRSSKDKGVFMDLVEWESLDLAMKAANQLESKEEFKPFLSAFESITIMEHFNFYK